MKSTSLHRRSSSRKSYGFAFLALVGVWLGVAQNTARAGGPNDTAYGTGALFSDTTGDFNTAFGEYSLYYNLTSVHNTAVGYASLGYTTGQYNTGTGSQSLYLNTLGQECSAFGAFALYHNTTAGQNSAVGAWALFNQSFSNSSAAWSSQNVAVGFKALYTNQPTSTITGIQNTALGTQALYLNSTGSNNIAIGIFAGYNLTTGSGNIDIGNQGVAGESNTIRIGDGTTQTTTHLTGAVLIKPAGDLSMGAYTAGTQP
jgi:hypothetical protein